MHNKYLICYYNFKNKMDISKSKIITYINIKE